ncbi:hypothetical protein D3C84_703030 [compost metagenome]
MALLRGHQAALLGQFHAGRGAGAVAGLHEFQHLFGIGQVLPGDLQLLLQRQGLDVGAGDAGADGQFQGCAVRLAGAQALQGGVAGGGVGAPEVHFVAGAEHRAEGVEAPFLVAGVDPAVAVAAHQPLAVGVEVGVQAGQQRGAGNARRGFGLAHAGDGGGQVLVGHAGLFHQAAEFGAVEAAPPLGADGGGLWIDRGLPGRGGGDLAGGLFQGRAAAGQGNAEGQQGKAGLHRVHSLERATTGASRAALRAGM